MEGNEDYGIWVLRPGGARSDADRASFALIAARAIETAGIPPAAVPQPLQHFPDWMLYVENLNPGKSVFDVVPYGLGVVDQDAIDPCTRAWLELLKRTTATIKSSAATLRLGDKDFKVLSGTIQDVCETSAACCARLGSGEIKARMEKRLGRSSPRASRAEFVRGSGAPTAIEEAQHLRVRGEREQDTLNRAARRRAVVGPALQRKRWKPSRLVSKSGVGKATVYGYLNGTRSWIAEENRKAIAEALDLKPAQLPK
jgi:hypothetical protein